MQVAEQAVRDQRRAGPHPQPKAAGKDEKAEGKGEKKTPAADETVTFAAGSFVVRMDQPLSRLADTLLDTQYVRGDERVYDDTGWTLGLTKNLECTRIVNQDVLAVPMHPWNGRRFPSSRALKGAALAIENTADTDLVRLRTALPGVRMLVAEEEIKGTRARPGRHGPGAPGRRRSTPPVTQALASLSLRVEALESLPTVKTHELALPRVAVLHTWLSTQDDGWYRLALEDLKLPYSYISTQDVARDPDLRGSFDVIIFPPVGTEHRAGHRQRTSARAPAPMEEDTAHPEPRRRPDRRHAPRPRLWPGSRTSGASWRRVAS